MAIAIQGANQNIRMALALVRLQPIHANAFMNAQPPEPKICTSAIGKMQF
ncbi:hypothetical protein Patl1_14211 [Pistacia atlantica]|uniref:Uncharacterized protein n=1 Tax=Pistacia atlantica TaxID=434234 RepID=A0ACC1AX63_9ROSI|nr:hypothetical protein Patl1_14211 [Pistacia atlantica]